MKRRSSPASKLLVVLAVAYSPLCAALAGQTNSATTSNLVAVPAMQVPHTGQAMMLSTARAGSRIVAVGDHGVVMLSDDGGRSHRQARGVPIDVTLTSVNFVGEREGWAVGHRGVVLHTKDGGETWSIQRIDQSEDRPLFAVHFLDAQHGVAVGLWSRVMVTFDGGSRWDAVALPAPEGAKKADVNLMALFADAKGRLYATGEKGVVLRSEDKGRTWAYETTGYKGSFWTGLATSDGTLIVAGLRGSLYRSGDGGRTWSRVETHSQSSITGLAMVGSQIVGVGVEGLTLRSDDGGLSFKADVCPERVDLTAIASGSGEQPIVYSRRGLATLRCDALKGLAR
jgi:photosystem II stability/assembly factor-like uncharacterized protein